MSMNRLLQHGCVQDAMPDFEQLMKLTEDRSKGKVREQEITGIREIYSQQDKRHAERTKRFVEGRLSRRWSRHLNLDETYRAPSQFTWRC